MSGTNTSFHARTRNASREAILDAVERRLSHDGLDELTFAQVAAEAGVAERTVYRHFRTKNELLEAFWQHVQRRLGLEASVRSWSDYLGSRAATFAEMERREPMMRALLSSAQARDARARLKRERQDGIRRVAREAVGDLPEPQFTELCALIHVIGSAPTWQALKDSWGIEGARAGRLAANAIQILADTAKRNGAQKTNSAKRREKR